MFLDEPRSDVSLVVEKNCVIVGLVVSKWLHVGDHCEVCRLDSVQSQMIQSSREGLPSVSGDAQRVADCGAIRWVSSSRGRSGRNNDGNDIQNAPAAEWI